MVEMKGIEPPTFCLQSRRSTPELHPRYRYRIYINKIIIFYLNFSSTAYDITSNVIDISHFTYIPNNYVSQGAKLYFQRGVIHLFTYILI
jgi:hypothetical protein